MAELRRQLGLWDGVAVFAGTILGSGIFVAPQGVAAAAPHPVTAILVWGLGALIAAAGASCYAECGARLPRAGGFFVFLRTAYGRPVAFVAGWVGLAVTYPASIAAMALVFATYLAGLVGLEGAWSVKVLAAGAVLAAASLSALGVRAGAASQRLLTFAKVAAVTTLIAAALVAPAGDAGPPSTATGLGIAGLSSLLGVMMWVLWTYDGWSDVTMLAGELKDPGRDLGRTVAFGMLLLWALYAGVQLAVMSLLSPEQAAVADRVVATAVGQRFGEAGSRLVAALVVLTTFGSVNAVVFTSSRLGFAMARDGVLPAGLGAVGQGGSPARSVAVIAALSLLYVFAASFQNLLGFFSFAVWIFYALVGVAVIILRRRRVGEPATFRAPFGPAAPALVVATALGMSGGLFADNPGRSSVGLAIMAAGALVYAGWRLLARPRTVARG